MKELTKYLKHHSPSTLGTFMDNRAGWFKKVFFGERGEPSIPMSRGTAIEEGINLLRKNREKNDLFGFELSPKAAAVNKFMSEVSANGLIITKSSEKIEEAKETIERLFDSIKEHDGRYYISWEEGTKKNSETKSYFFDDIQESDDTQVKINFNSDLFELPVTGYIDYLINGEMDIFGEFCGGKIIDLKTTGKAPSGLSWRYMMQGAAYWAALGKTHEVKFVYLVLTSQIKVVEHVMTTEELEKGLALLSSLAQKSEEVVRAYNTSPELIKSCFGPTGLEFIDKKEISSYMQYFYGVS